MARQLRLEHEGAIYHIPVAFTLREFLQLLTDYRSAQGRSEKSGLPSPEGANILSS